jgi:Leucine-rich repeat (LRR) protein
MTKLPIQFLSIVAMLLSLAVHDAAAQSPAAGQTPEEKLQKVGIELRRYYLDDFHKYLTNDDKVLEDKIKKAISNTTAMYDLITSLPVGSELQVALKSDPEVALNSKSAYCFLGSFRNDDLGEAVKYLRQIPRLKRISFSNTKITTLSAEQLNELRQCKDLTDLDLSNTSLDDKGLGRFTSLRTVRTLRLNNVELQETGGLMWVVYACSRRSLDLRLANVSVKNGDNVVSADDWLPYFENLSFDGIDLSGLELTSKGIASLDKFEATRMTLVKLAGNKLVDNDLRYLKNFKKLKVLDLGDNKELTDGGLRKLNFGGLTELSLNGIGRPTNSMVGAVTDVEIKRILENNKTTLVKLNLAGTSTLTTKTESVAVINAMQNLEALNISETGIDNDGLIAIWEGKNAVPNLLFLDISSTAVTDKGLIHSASAGFPRLKVIRIASTDTKVTAGGVSRRNALLKVPHNYAKLVTAQ